MTSLGYELLKMSLFTGTTFTWVGLVKYIYAKNLFEAHTPVVMGVILFLNAIFLFFAYSSYSKVKKIKSSVALKKYLAAAKSNNPSRLRRLILGNPMEASQYIRVLDNQKDVNQYIKIIKQ
jgi:hypothetical protein